MDYTHFLTPALGVGSLVVLFVLMLMRGDIVPRKQVDAEMKQKDEAIELWRTLYERSEGQHVKKDALIAALMDTTQTTRNVLTAMHEAAGLGQGGSRVPTSEKD